MSSILNDKTSSPPFTQIDLATSDTFGQISTKRFTDENGQSMGLPSLTGWNFIGGSNFGRAVVSHSSNADVDIVARDLSRKTVRFKRFRASNIQWSPGTFEWFDLGGEGIGEPIAIARAGAPDVVDVFSLSADGTLWHRAFVVPPFVADPGDQQYEINYASYCCAQFNNPSCPCIP